MQDIIAKCVLIQLYFPHFHIKVEYEDIMAQKVKKQKGLKNLIPNRCIRKFLNGVIRNFKFINVFISSYQTKFHWTELFRILGKKNVSSGTTLTTCRKLRSSWCSTTRAGARSSEPSTRSSIDPRLSSCTKSFWYENKIISWIYKLYLSNLQKVQK